MRKLLTIILMVHQDESGHAQAALASLVAGIGGIVLACGAADESDVITIIGGVVLGVGVLAAALVHHMTVDYDIYARLEKLEGKK